MYLPHSFLSIKRLTVYYNITQVCNKWELILPPIFSLLHHHHHTTVSIMVNSVGAGFFMSQGLAYKQASGTGGQKGE